MVAPPNNFCALQQFYSVFSLVTVYAIKSHSVAGSAEKHLQAHVAAGLDLRKVTSNNSMPAKKPRLKDGRGLPLMRGSEP